MSGRGLSSRKLSRPKRRRLYQDPVRAAAIGAVAVAPTVTAPVAAEGPTVSHWSRLNADVSSVINSFLSTPHEKRPINRTARATQQRICAQCLRPVLWDAALRSPGARSDPEIIAECAGRCTFYGPRCEDWIARVLESVASTTAVRMALVKDRSGEAVYEAREDVLPIERPAWVRLTTMPVYRSLRYDLERSQPAAWSESMAEAMHDQVSSGQTTSEVARNLCRAVQGDARSNRTVMLEVRTREPSASAAELDRYLRRLGPLREPIRFVVTLLGGKDRNRVLLRYFSQPFLRAQDVHIRPMWTTVVRLPEVASLGVG